MSLSFKNDLLNDKLLNMMFNSNALEPRANVSNTAAGFNLEIELPGFKKSEIQVETKNGLLTVTANRASKTTYVSQEFGNSMLKRSWHLPKTVNVDAVDASYDSGVLSLTLPYKAIENRLERKIEIR